jgi:Na+/melibiose symporter-like transporter
MKKIIQMILAGTTIVLVSLYARDAKTFIGLMILIAFTAILLSIWCVFVKSLYLEIFKPSLKRQGKKLQDCKKL